MEKMKSINTLTLSTNKNNFANTSNNNTRFSTEKFNPLTSKNLLNQISFQSLVNKKTGTPKNFQNNNFSSNLANNHNNVLETGRIHKNPKNEDFFKKQNTRSFNPTMKNGI